MTSAPPPRSPLIPTLAGLLALALAPAALAHADDPAPDPTLTPWFDLAQRGDDPSAGLLGGVAFTFDTSPPALWVSSAPRALLRFTDNTTLDATLAAPYADRLTLSQAGLISASFDPQAVALIDAQGAAVAAHPLVDGRLVDVQAVSGTVYLLTASPAALHLHTPDGAPRGTIPLPFIDAPSGFAFDPDQSLWIGDAANPRLVKLTRQGDLLASIDLPEPTASVTRAGCLGGPLYAASATTPGRLLVVTPDPDDAAAAAVQTFDLPDADRPIAALAHTFDRLAVSLPSDGPHQRVAVLALADRLLTLPPPEDPPPPARPNAAWSLALPLDTPRLNCPSANATLTASLNPEASDAGLTARVQPATEDPATPASVVLTWLPPPCALFATGASQLNVDITVRLNTLSDTLNLTRACDPRTLPLGAPSEDDLDRDGLDDACQPDGDQDGLPLQDELALGLDPNAPDSDNDGVPDGDEVAVGEDTDGDGLINGLDPDSDNDGLSDGDEANVNADPLRIDTDGDGFLDSEDPDPDNAAVPTPITAIPYRPDDDCAVVTLDPSTPPVTPLAALALLGGAATAARRRRRQRP